MEPIVEYQQNHEFRTAIMWFRRDLRVDDNPALVAALTASATVIPVFIWAPEEEGQFQAGRCSRWWSKHSLVDLQQALAALGSRLIIRRSTDSTAALLKVVAEVGAEAVFFNHLYDPISLMRDHDCKRGLTAAGVAQRTFNGDMLYEPWEVLDSNKQPYSTFDDFWNSVRNMPVPPPFPVSAPEAMPPVPANISSLAVTEVDWFFTAEQEASSDQLKFKWKPGVGGAIAELERFVGERLHSFEHDRAKVDRDSTSRLSPWIHIGSISVRYIYYRVRQCQAEWLAVGVDKSRSCDDFLQQVGYREYSRYLAFHFPFIHERSLLRHLRACPWRIDQQAFKAWRQGQTGYPIIDAAMRQLWSSGWCHNRARVVAASFLVKDLLLPWQWGLKHYWDAQIDADLECDALGWQYVSGGMSDAHPFSYMMDLETEARRFDPDGEYVRRWLPVLSRLPTEHIHAPWKAPPQVLAAADVELGCNYPAPIISRSDARANVEYACSVLDKCAVAQSSESSGRNPYRAPTYPLVAPGAAGASSGALPAGTGGNAGTGIPTPGGSAPQSQQNRPGQQTCGGGVSTGEGEGATGRGGVSGQGPQPGSRSVSAAHGGVSSGGAGGPQSAQPSGAAVGGAATEGGRVQQGGAGSMAPPPPHHQTHAQRAAAGVGSGGYGAGGSSGGAAAGGSAAAAGARAPGGSSGGAGGGMVYYHPGDTAGHEMLERILQQQRRTRGAARHQDGSGTNNPPPPQQHHNQHPQQQAPGLELGMPGFGDAAAAAAAAAAAWAERVRACQEDDEAVALWQQQQMMQGGTAAFAFEQAMQMLLARRRMGDGVSNIVGEKGGAGGRDGEPDELMLEEDGDSEEVVSNTVNLNVTAFTGASCHRNQAGTARGARRRGREEARAHDERGREREEGEEEEERYHDGEGADSPGRSSPPRSAGDEADPDADRRTGDHGAGNATLPRRRPRNEGEDGEQDGQAEEGAMEWQDGAAGGDEDAGGDGADGGSPAARTPQGGCSSDRSEDDGGDSDADGGQVKARGPEHNRAPAGPDADPDRMVETDDGCDDRRGELPQERGGSGGAAANALCIRTEPVGSGAAGGGEPRRGSGTGGCAADGDAEMAVSPRGAAAQGLAEPPQLGLGLQACPEAAEERCGGDQQHGAHKRRRSASLDWE